MSNRRAFIKQVSLSAGALSVASLSGLAACTAEAADRKLGIALVGLGRYATGQLAPALLETRHCELRGIVTGSPDKAAKWKQQYNLSDKNIYNYDTFDQIKDNPDIDIVYVVLPNNMHAEYVIRAAEAGKDVICEKPMANTVADCERMIAACKKAGVSLNIGYRLHYEPHHLAAIDIIHKKKELGKIKLFEGGFGFRLTDKKRWRLNKEMAGGGPLMDVGIYVLQAARYLVGEEPIAVRAFEVKTEPDIFDQVEETLYWTMEFPGGAFANCSTSYAAGTHHLRVSGDKGWLYMTPCYGYASPEGKTNQYTLDIEPVNQQAAHMDGIARHLLFGDKRNNISGEEGLRDMKV
ncbi:MAG: Gfo/Idh/MocA family oxidoreductase, partial [Bacteroidota bacterium]